jgi:hypothetical protein
MVFGNSLILWDYSLIDDSPIGIGGIGRRRARGPGAGSIYQEGMSSRARIEEEKV